MGNGNKNKKGGGPKQKGRLAAALVSAQAAQASRAKAALAEEKRVERAKALKVLAAGGGAKVKKAKPSGGAVGKGKSVEKRVEVEEVLDQVAVPGADGEKAIKVQRKRRTGTIPYGLNERILLVGEGNFSFAHSLLLFSPPQITPGLLLATSYDSLQVAQEKYPDLMEHVDALQLAGARVVFGVDATALEKCKEVKEALASGGWDKVGFNFPHVGAGITDQDRNVRANQTLILKFLRSVAPFLRVGPSSAPAATKKRAAPILGKRPAPSKKRVRRPSLSSGDDSNDDGEALASDPDEDTLDLRTSAKPAGAVLLTLRTHAPYSLWSLSALATRGPLLAPSILPRPLPKAAQPTYVVRRSMEFETGDYEGYEHRRTVGFKEGVSSGKNEDLMLSARERGLKKHGAGEPPEATKEDGEDVVEGRRGKKGSMRTWEFELVRGEDPDDMYD